MSYGNITYILPDNEVVRIFATLWKFLEKTYVPPQRETLPSLGKKDKTSRTEEEEIAKDFEKFIAQMKTKSKQLKKEVLDKNENLLSYADSRIICAFAE